MVPSTTVVRLMLDLLAADLTTFNQGGEVGVGLIKGPFTPSGNLVWADISANEADFVTYAEKEGGSPAGTGLDPVTGRYILAVPPPVGGFRWETTATTNLPQTIYGWYVRNQDSDALLCSALFDTPILLNGLNQVVEIPAVTLTLAANPLA